MTFENAPPAARAMASGDDKHGLGALMVVRDQGLKSLLRNMSLISPNASEM